MANNANAAALAPPGVGVQRKTSANTNGIILPTEVEAFLAISPDTMLIVQDNYHHDVLFITSTKTIIGWTLSQSFIRIYFHQGEALIIHSKEWETEDMSEISQRLKSVSNGSATQVRLG